MTNVERVRDCIRANSRYGADELLRQLSVENAVTLAAIADALEQVAEAMGQKNETAPIMRFPICTYRELMEALKDG